MNHHPQRLHGYIRYIVRYVTGGALTPVRPVWLDVRNCTGPDPVFDLPGTGGAGSRLGIRRSTGRSGIASPTRPIRAALLAAPDADDAGDRRPLGIKTRPREPIEGA